MSTHSVRAITPDVIDGPPVIAEDLGIANDEHGAHGVHVASEKNDEHDEHDEHDENEGET